MERTHALDRWLYRGRRPNRLARLINGASARLAGAGIGPARLVMLEVAGRRTGKTISFPLVVADYQGERYLVSMLGEGTNWVRNVRAANGRAVLRHGYREVIRLDEVEAGQRPALLRRYLECSPGARSHIPVRPGAPLEEFERIAAQYPVFHVSVWRTPVGSGTELAYVSGDAAGAQPGPDVGGGCAGPAVGGVEPDGA